MQANIFKIKRNELADGSGLRTTIYFKGCPLRCVWCSTPQAHERPNSLGQQALSLLQSLCQRMSHRKSGIFGQPSHLYPGHLYILPCLYGSLSVPNASFRRSDDEYG